MRRSRRKRPNKLSTSRLTCMWKSLSFPRRFLTAQALRGNAALRSGRDAFHSAPDLGEQYMGTLWKAPLPDCVPVPLHRSSSRMGVLSLVLPAVLLLSTMLARADDVAACSEGDFLDALNLAAADGTGLVTFTQQCSITLSGPIEIATDMIIDGGTNGVSLSAGGQFQIFQV